MSYCRWSSDNFCCDLYCYADASGGYATHVAGNRVLGDIPKLPIFKLPGSDEDWKNYFQKMNEQHKFLDTAKREKINLDYAGESFNDPDLDSFLKRLLHLRETGYKFPDYVLEQVREEKCSRWS